MALTYVFAVTPAGAVGVTLKSGAAVTYTPNGAGVITGVPPQDAEFMNQQNPGRLVLLCGTGATADRPTPATSQAAGANVSGLPPTFGATEFWDTTLSKMCFYVGGQSSTGWVDYTGAAV